jgi:phosphatidate cytidylyltransferase
MPIFLRTAVEFVATATGLAPRAIVFFAAMVLALTIGSVVRVLRQLVAPTPQSKKLVESLKTWWALMAVLAVALVLGRTGVVIAVGGLSMLALREFVGRLRGEWAPKNLLTLTYLLAIGQYLAIWMGWETVFVMIAPLAIVVLAAVVRMASAPPPGFVAAAGGAVLAMMLCVYGLSHAAMLHTLPDSSNPVAGAAGWLLYLLLLTEVNDMGQAMWGRALGAHKPTRHISPNKSWEGFVGGFLTTIVLAVVTAPWITPLAEAPPRLASTPLADIPYLAAILVGAAVALAGIVGDLTMSSAKRDYGLKDFGALLPGHGGVLDRFDSLTITAPVFFHLIRWFDY